MNEKELVRASKRLSLHLRHAPERIGIRLDEAGWVGVDDLLAALREHGMALTRDQLNEVVAGNNKQRFAFDDAGERIRANQGHSVAVDLDLSATTPPDVLYHGTVERFLPAILRDGLRPMARHDVHLSAAITTARTVAARRGKPIVLEVDAAAMVAAGHTFRVSANEVWLTEHVPSTFLRTRQDSNLRSQP